MAENLPSVSSLVKTAFTHSHTYSLAYLDFIQGNIILALIPKFFQLSGWMIGLRVNLFNIFFIFIVIVIFIIFIVIFIFITHIVVINLPDELPKFLSPYKSKAYTCTVIILSTRTDRMSGANRVDTDHRLDTAKFGVWSGSTLLATRPGVIQIRQQAVKWNFYIHVQSEAKSNSTKICSHWL